jgi:hypothetical protein
MGCYHVACAGTCFSSQNPLVVSSLNAAVVLLHPSSQHLAAAQHCARCVGWLRHWGVDAHLHAVSFAAHLLEVGFFVFASSQMAGVVRGCLAVFRRPLCN